MGKKLRSRILTSPVRSGFSKNTRKNAQKAAAKSSKASQRPGAPRREGPRSEVSSPLSSHQSVTSPSQLREFRPAPARGNPPKYPLKWDLLDENEQLKARITALEAANDEEKRSNAERIEALQNRLAKTERIKDSFETRFHKALPQIKVDGVRRFANGYFAVIPQAVDDGQDCGAWPVVQAPWSKGLKNSGIMCYRISVLQALLHTPAFYRYLGSMHKNCNLVNEACVVCALQHLANKYWNHPYQEGKPTDPPSLSGPFRRLDQFNKACNENPGEILVEEFRRAEQADAGDFVSYLMGQILAKELPSDDTTFRKTFVIEYESSWTCRHCQTLRVQQDAPCSGGNGSAWFVPVGSETGPGEGLSLATYLDRSRNTKVEWRCEADACKDTPSGTGDGLFRDVATRISHSPDVLIVVIHRWWANYTLNDYGNKIFEDIAFEEVLDLGQLTNDGTALRYQLDGVAAHQGESLHGGHYISAVRKIDEDKFQTINDDHFLRQHRGGGFREMKHPICYGTTKEYKENNRWPEGEFQPCVLVYRKLT